MIDKARFLAIPALAALACGTPSPPSDAEQSEPGVVARLDSIDPVRDRFNAEVDKPRFLTILSPT